jgi:hypothetical protein
MEEVMTEVELSGSCLCGEIKYKVAGELERFSHCHCSRCRKATGTGHATNLLVSPLTSIEWLQGKGLLARYTVPEAKRFYNCFCARCGSPMPRELPQLDSVLIPAGSVDSDIPVLPEHRIFWESRSAWSCEAGSLPVYSEYPSVDD